MTIYCDSKWGIAATVFWNPEKAVYVCSVWNIEDNYHLFARPFDNEEEAEKLAARLCRNLTDLEACQLWVETRQCNAGIAKHWHEIPDKYDEEV